MKHPTADIHFFLHLVFFLYLIVQNAGVAPDMPGTYTVFPLSNTKINRKLIDSSGNCPVRCHCHMILHRLVTDCSAKGMTAIPRHIHVATHELLLLKNKITSLSYNTSLAKLEILNASDNNITVIDKNWLSSLVNLQLLDISKNQLQSKPDNLFSYLSLHTLNLSDNKLTEITKEMFEGMHLLQELDLSKNHIENINSWSFQHFQSLVYLDLSSNKLTNLQHEWFMNMKNLEKLNMKNNRLQNLSNVAFWHLNNLQYLDVSSNSICSVGLLSFRDLLKLECLNISNNNIEVVQKGVFRPLESIKIIDLSNNPLKSFDGVFMHSRTLTTLYMKQLKGFKELTASSLSGLTQLKVLDFSGTKSFSYINPYAFATTKNLESLDVSNCNISSLRSGVFRELKRLETIKLRGNPWRCDCYLYWILLWLSENTSTRLLFPSETVCEFPQSLKYKVLLDALDHDMVCTNASIQKYTEKAQFGVGSTALLHCEASGSPLPTITWVTPQKVTFHWLGNGRNCSAEENCLFPSNHPEAHFADDSELTEERFLLMKNGDLLIRDVERGDGGFYVCVASNPLSNQSVAIRLMLDYRYFVHIKIVSILVGLATSFGFLLLTLISVLVVMILKRCGVKCPCNNGKTSPKAQQIRKILESMEHYKKQQLEKLRENYNFQVQRIKDNCMQQMERLRESYSSQAERLRDIRDYGTLQIDRIRENYYLQVQRVRDYSTSQIERLRENYIFQRNRIRKFSTHHLYKLRENYKLQQQHLNKILENLNIESCRNVCQRTDSMVFEPDITLENVFVPKICLAQSHSKNMDSVENSSQISAYFTPEEACSEVSGHESDGTDFTQNYMEETSQPDFHEDHSTSNQTEGEEFDRNNMGCCLNMRTDIGETVV